MSRQLMTSGHDSTEGYKQETLAKRLSVTDKSRSLGPA